MHGNFFIIIMSINYSIKHHLGSKRGQTCPDVVSDCCFL